MSNKAILRVQKLKSADQLRRSLLHTYREQPTPNADPMQTVNNYLSDTRTGLTSEEIYGGYFGKPPPLKRHSDRVMRRFSKMLPDKVRKNAVLAIEYLITASPDAKPVLDAKNKDEGAIGSLYFADTLQWIRAKHGAENVLAYALHRDETTPHLVVYVVPKDDKGKLNCRQFLGGTKNRLSELQDEFFEEVAVKHGLERGLKRSKAKHQTIRQYYTALNQTKASIDQKLVSMRKTLAKGGAELEALRQEVIAAENRIQTAQALARQSAQPAPQVPEVHEQPSRGPKR